MYNIIRDRKKDRRINIQLDEKGFSPAILKRYNNLMESLGYSSNEIGENTAGDKTENWTLKDTVSECAYILSTYYEGGHMNCDLKSDDPKAWRSEVGKLQRYINAYSKMCDENNIHCFQRHCSEYDG